VIEVASRAILKIACKPGERHLVLCDNLNSQTVKTNPQFSKLLDKMCNADVWNLLPGNTDEIQVVDHGLGASVKREAEQVQSEWLQNEDNWAEWTSGRLSASRRRVLSTLWYGEAYDIVCRKFKFCKVFDKLGSALTLDGSRDNLIKLEGLEQFSFDMNDANRDSKTGLFPQPQLVSNDNHDDSDEADELEELEANSGSNSSSDNEGGDTTDEGELEGTDFKADDGIAIEAEVPDGRPKSIFKRRIAHRYDVGWYHGTVMRQITMSDRSSDNGKYEILFDGERRRCLHALLIEDYGPSEHWVLIKD
jgi:hypothetical protein